MSFLDLVVSPGVLIGTIVGVIAAVAIGKFFPDHDLSFLQALVALAGFVFGLVLDLVGKSRKDR